MKRENLFGKKEDCCGCGACENICPKGAITMCEDERGFIYPHIDNEKCIKCNACKRVCGYQNDILVNVPSEVYAAASIDTDLLKTTASGGIFSVIAKKVLQANGIVFGVALIVEGDTLVPKHIKVECFEELDKLKGSKYVQSYCGNIFQQVKEEVKKNRLVLFSGTPCQVAGLNSYLGEKYDNLYTIDIICHGVPNAKMFKDYLSCLSSKNNGKIIDYKFRDKSKGQSITSKYIYINRRGDVVEKIVPGKVTSFVGLFLEKEIYRENCYSCKFAKQERVSDITIGDYWGVHQELNSELKLTSMSNSKGISCLLVNTKNGKKILELISDSIEKIPSTIESVAKYNEQLNNPCKYSCKREKIFKLYEECGYESVEKYYQRSIVIKKYFYWLESIVPKEIKRRMKCVIRNRRDSICHK